MTFLIDALAFIFILGAAVVLHEFGHFIVAKLLGIRVETFSVGFGPRIVGRRWGTTDYRVSVIPLGGYVKLGGDESNAAVEGAGVSNIPRGERFDLRPRWQKFLVGVAGPVMNVLTALAIPFAGALISGVPLMPSPVVEQVRPGGAADVAGLRPGDRIVAFNGKDNPKWDDMSLDALLSPGQTLPMTIERGGQRISLTIKPTEYNDGNEVVGDLGLLPYYGDLPVKIDSVEAGSPADEAGFKPGDYVLTIGGEAVRNKEQISQYIQQHGDQAINIRIKRSGALLDLAVGTRRLAGGRIGVSLSEDIPLRPAGPAQAASHSLETNIRFLRATWMALGQVFSGKRSMRDTFSGPIGIAQASANAANELGWSGVFAMLALLSLNLGVFNLLPIPVLDGGMIFMLFVEGALGWVGVKLSLRMRERIQQAGFVFLLLLMGLIITNDFLKMASRSHRTDSNRPAAAASPK